MTHFVVLDFNVEACVPVLIDALIDFRAYWVHTSVVKPFDAWEARITADENYTNPS